MSERMTSVRLESLGTGSGWSEYGRQTPGHMIHMLRRNAEIAKEDAERILDADDSEFVVETYLGPCAQRKTERLWPLADTNEGNEK